MLRKETERSKSRPPKRTKFSLRGQPVKRSKLERFKAEHPKLKPRRSGKYHVSSFAFLTNKTLATPSSIACATEASELVSREIFDDTKPLEVLSLSPGSSMIGGTAPSQTSSEIARRLWLDCEVLEQHPGGFMHDCELENPEKKQTESFDIDHSLVMHTSNQQVSVGSRNAINPHCLRHLIDTISKDTDTPDSHCPALAHFNWWLKYGQWCTKSPDKVVEDALAQYFQGLVIEHNTFEADMDHEEKLHQHHVMALEAGLSEQDGIEDEQRHLYSPSETDTTMTSPFDSESVSSKPMPVSRTIATSILLNRKLWHSSKQVSASSSYPVDVRWCVSELMKAKLGVLHESRRVSDWVEAIIFLLDDCRVLAFSGRKKAFKGFISLTAVLLSSILLSETDKFSPDQADISERIRATCAHVVGREVICQAPSSPELQCYNRLLKVLMNWFDPLGSEHDDAVVESTVQELHQCLEEFTADWDVLLNEVGIHKLVIIAFTYVTVLRYGQVYPLNVEGFFTVQQTHNDSKSLSVSDETIKDIGHEELAWTFAWGAVYLNGPQIQATARGWSAEFQLLEPEDLQDVSEILCLRWSQLETAIGFTHTDDKNILFSIFS